MLFLYVDRAGWASFFLIRWINPTAIEVCPFYNFDTKKHIKKNCRQL